MSSVVIISVSLISGMIIFGSDQEVGEISRVVIISLPLISGVIIFGSDQEVGEMMKAVRRNNCTGEFTWIGSDGWGGRSLVSTGNEPEVGHFFTFW